MKDADSHYDRIFNRTGFFSKKDRFLKEVLMEKPINRRSALKYLAAATAATSVGTSVSAAETKKEETKFDGGWQYKDLDYEKHIPVVSVERSGEIAVVTVEVKHPQNADHHISAFSLYTQDRIEITRCDLHPGMSVPKVAFQLKIKSGTELIATTDCNLHGIWMKRFKS